MRTTLDIAEDVLLAARTLARREERTTGAVISDLARHALMTPQVPQVGGDEPQDEFFGFRPLPSRGVVITDELINRLRDDDD